MRRRWRPDIAIRTQGVHGAADNTESMSRHAMKRLEHALDGSDAVYGSHLGDGWQSPVELRACALNREDRLVSLPRQLGDPSAKSKDSANGYDSADAEARARPHAAVQDLGKA
ncbi:hypothetical protein [Streptomyces beihaiensis]|uniref:Uncharacterized protein n=1 Tax=Streptomyces beihaiensis TaxID=2984495 RepID=A0ABT3TXI8_9ACTN|nr:hypothetical protein [Streptomyces beihaiensis]MCX3061772.1 hypothetical protein [Streptomyces beihaiensis]